MINKIGLIIMADLGDTGDATLLWASGRSRISQIGGGEAQSCGSCMPQVEFEFSTWVPLKATTDCHSSSGQLSFVCLYMYANEWWEKSHCWNGSGHHCQLPFGQWLPLPIAILAVALNSSSGGELKLYLGWKRNAQSLKQNPIIWRWSHLLSWDKFVKIA